MASKEMKRCAKIMHSWCSRFKYKFSRLILFDFKIDLPFFLPDVTAEEVSDEERERYISNLKELDQFLGPYPYDK